MNEWKGPRIHFPTEEENKAAMNEALARMKSIRRKQRNAADIGVAALADLMVILRENHSTDQPYIIRRLLFSLWNGKPVDLSDTLCLDWELKQKFASVLAGFGFEDDEVNFFYPAIEGGFRGVGLLDWFREEGDQ